MWVKLCGFRDPEMADYAVCCGASAIGLNFFDKSPRCVDRKTARRIVEKVDARARCVGVFVNATTSVIEDTVRQTGIDTIQLHGDEPPQSCEELCDRLPLCRVIRAMSIESTGLDSVAEFLRDSTARGATPWAVLADAKVKGLYGGTGQSPPWDVIASGYDPAWPPLILAGGLTPTNVRASIAAVHPWGVDTAGGVERNGVKDRTLIREFLEAAQNDSVGESFRRG